MSKMDKWYAEAAKLSPPEQVNFWLEKQRTSMRNAQICAGLAAFGLVISLLLRFYS